MGARERARMYGVEGLSWGGSGGVGAGFVLYVALGGGLAGVLGGGFDRGLFVVVSGVR